MLQFTTDDYEFEVDGVIHALPDLTIDKFEKIADLVLIKNPVEQMKAFQEAILAEATPETAEAVRRLGLKKITEIFRDWTGLSGKQVAPGESLRSPE